MDIRIVAKYAIDSLASSVIFVHNHPSGAMKPSIYDEKLTTKMKEGLALLDVKLADSIIIGPHEMEIYSFNDECRL